jgi:predicted nucleic acid-binding protein
MASTCLLDSTVIIDAINNRNRRSQLLDGLLAEGILLACCSINITEVCMGMRPKEAERTEVFLASLEFYPVTWEVAKYAGALYREWRQKGVTLALPDLTIAAVAITNGLHFATDNRKDFPMSDLRFYPLPYVGRVE